ncbi:MAG: FAD-binding oxidoreductase [Gammaproteobacteria bacterium]
MATRREALQPLFDRLSSTLGEDHVLTDAGALELFSEDIYSAGEKVIAVLAPGNTEELASVVGLCTEAGYTVIPRGGGMSYTGGYLATQPNSVIIDLRRMNRVLDINAEDMTVTVECGCTWLDLHNALKGSGLRTPFWGTLSGIHATVGGGLSQNGIFWGSGRHGSALDSVLSLNVVLADGSIVPTGSAARESADGFFRHYGPDLTGLFCADTGALGFKATATLKLIDELPHHRFASFAFDDADRIQEAMSELARRGLPMECFGFDPFLSGQRMKRESVLRDVKSLGNMLKAAGSVSKAVKEGAKVALAGRRFMDDVQYSLHLIFEERDEAAADVSLRSANEICVRFGGRELDNSIPKILRANPFTPLNNVVGPKGERWAPIHVMVPHSRAVATTRAVMDYFASQQAVLDQHDIGIGYLFATVAQNGFVIEPVFYWPDAMGALHADTVESHIFKKLPGFEADTAAREAVATLRAGLNDVFARQGGIHMQIGKGYPFKETHNKAAYNIIEKMKAAVDPKGHINPGSLGLNSDD